MRITENMGFNQIRENSNKKREKLQDLQIEASTLKRINKPSDDPINASKVLGMRTDKSNNDQFQFNSKLADAYLNNTDSALENLSDILVRAKELAIGQSSSASSSPQTRVAIAEEINQLYQQAISTSNRRVGDRYLFGGFQTNQPPVDSDGNYRGDDGQMMVEVSRDVYISMNLPGYEAFNTQPAPLSNSTKPGSSQSQTYGVPGGQFIQRNPASTSQLGDSDGVLQSSPNAQTNRQIASSSPQTYQNPSLNNPNNPMSDANGNPIQQVPVDRPKNYNLFSELQKLRLGLLSGNLDSVRETLDSFEELHTKINAMRAKVGSRLSGLQQMTQSLEKEVITNAQLTSTLEDADIAQVASDMAKEEALFKNSLQASSKLIQPTLLDFLK